MDCAFGNQFRQPVHCSAVGSFCAAKHVPPSKRTAGSHSFGADGADPPTGHTDGAVFQSRGLLPVIQLFKRFSDSFSPDTVQECCTVPVVISADILAGFSSLSSS